MILDKPEHTLTRGGLAGEKQFKIALSAKIYSMLSDKLYSDKIGSVVREICSNAWDGMKMKSLATGQPQEPFRVTLPTELEPHFIVEDFGVGMPDEQAQELYSTLGLSTKELTNDQIGAFGLGSKSPFAVTDTFTVENTYDGVTYYYLCFKSEDGLPSILPTGKKVEDRPNGVKVIIPAPGYNYSAYQNALQRQLVAMEPKPIVTNGLDFEFAQAKKLSENEFGYILTNATEFGLRGRSAYAKMGMVFYPIDLSQLSLSYDEKNGITNLSQHSALVLHLPIGAVEPVPSREGLVYDARTNKNIREQIVEYRKVFRKQLADNVAKMTDPLDAYNEILTIKASTGINLLHDDIHINGWPINDDPQPNIFPTFVHEYLYTPPAKTDAQGNILADQDKPELRQVTQSRYYYEVYDTSDTRLNIKRQQVGLNTMKFSFLNLIVGGTYSFMLWDEVEPKHRISRMKSVLNAMNRGERLMVVHQNPNYKGVQNDFTAFIQGLDTIRPGTSAKCVTRFSAVEKPDFERGERKKKEDSEPIIGMHVIRPGSTYEHTVSQVDIDKYAEDDNFVGNACYVKLHRNDLVDYKAYGLEALKNFSNASGMYVFLIRATGMGRLKSLEEIGVIEFQEHIENIVGDYTPTETFKKRESCIEIYNDKTDWYNVTTIGFVNKITGLLSIRSQEIPKFFAVCKDIYDVRFSKIQLDKPTRVLNKLKDHGLFAIFKDKEWAKAMAVDVKTPFIEAEESLERLYPLLPHLIGQYKGYHSHEWIIDACYQHIVDYTNLRKLQSEQITVTPY